MGAARRSRTEANRCWLLALDDLVQAKKAPGCLVKGLWTISRHNQVAPPIDNKWVCVRPKVLIKHAQRLSALGNSLSHFVRHNLSELMKQRRDPFIVGQQVVSNPDNAQLAVQGQGEPGALFCTRPVERIAIDFDQACRTPIHERQDIQRIASTPANQRDTQCNRCEMPFQHTRQRCWTKPKPEVRHGASRRLPRCVTRFAACSPRRQAHLRTDRARAARTWCRRRS